MHIKYNQYALLTVDRWSNLYAVTGQGNIIVKIVKVDADKVVTINVEDDTECNLFTDTYALYIVDDILRNKWKKS